MHNPLLPRPTPDFDALVRILAGEQTPRRVPLIELSIDGEVLQAIHARYRQEPWVPLTDDTKAAYCKQIVTLYAQLGYDCAPVWGQWENNPEPPRICVADTAALSRGERAWVGGGRGLIPSWEAFERFPWGRLTPKVADYELMAQYLPGGMRVVLVTTVFQYVMEVLLGYEGLFTLLYDDPDLVAQVFEGWGGAVYDFYAALIDADAVGAIFHADDLGFKTGPLMSPDAFQRLVFPWLKKYADLAHAHGKPFWLHSCGNLYTPPLIEDLIETVAIDGLHSFQDVILPVADFKARYGDRVATLGGVDMDRLARLDEEALRAYVRGILDACMPGGRFALGSGNTVANYIPLENYAIMLDESRRWP